MNEYRKLLIIKIKQTCIRYFKYSQNELKNSLKQKINMFWNHTVSPRVKLNLLIRNSSGY